VLTLFTTPVIYLASTGWRHRLGQKSRRRWKNRKRDMSLSVALHPAAVATTPADLGVALAGIWLFSCCRVAPLPPIEFPASGLRLDAGQPRGDAKQRPRAAGSAILARSPTSPDDIGPVENFPNIPADLSAWTGHRTARRRDDRAAHRRRPADLPTSLRTNPNLSQVQRRLGPGHHPSMDIRNA